MVFLGDQHYRPLASKWGSSWAFRRKGIFGVHNTPSRRHGAIGPHARKAVTQPWSHLNGGW